MAMQKRKLDAGQYNLKDQVVAINRVTKVVKGGKNMSFAALVVVGDPVCRSGGLRLGQGQGSSAGDPQGDRIGQEEPGPHQPDGDHDSPPGTGPLSVPARCC